MSGQCVTCGRAHVRGSWWPRHPFKAQDITRPAPVLDIPEAESAAIAAAHPMQTKNFALYDEAQRLVNARHMKGELVELVNWLLVRIEEATFAMCSECGGSGDGPDRCDGPGDVYQDPCATCDGKGRVRRV